MKAAICFRTRLKLVGLAVAAALAGLLCISPPVQAAPVITLTPSSGAVGTEVTVTGTVFSSYVGDSVYIFFDDEEIDGSPLIVPDTSEFSITHTVPADASVGPHTYQVKAEVGSTYLIADATFTVERRRLTLSQSYGPVGTEITINGYGFYADNQVDLVYADTSIIQIDTVTVSETGRFSVTYTIPPSIGGDHTITATDITDTTAEVTFEVTPEITLSSLSGGPGDIITVSGHGFGYRCDLTIVMGTKTIASGQSNSSGEFDISVNVPSLDAGSYNVLVQDEEGNRDVATFSITAGASLSVINGAVGGEVTARGSGFTSGGTVTIDFATVRVATETINNSGGFTVTFTVPAVGAGVHTVVISDGVNTRQIDFTIESTAPATPVHSLPANAAQTTVNAYLDWEDVSDESLPVVYHLQVASDASFSALIVDRDDLTESEYTLGATENLTVGSQAKSYYWRVKAEDAAGNESTWSSAWSFIISPPSAPSVAVPATGSSSGSGATATATTTATVSEEAEMIFAEDELVTLEWKEVDTVSGAVTYAVEIAEDPDFSDPVLSLNQISGSSYLLSDEELLALKNNIPYYWRVKAVDSDNVSGGWSETASFTIASSFQWPSWATYLIIALVAAGLIYLAFRIGKRTALKQPD